MTSGISRHDLVSSYIEFDLSKLVDVCTIGWTLSAISCITAVYKLTSGHNQACRLRVQ